MEQKSQQTEQQVTNAALVSLAATGDSLALEQLWAVNEDFIQRKTLHWYNRYKDTADRLGLTIEDLVQEGYFALIYAAKHYNAERGDFTAYLNYAMLHQIKKAACGEHTRLVTTKDGRQLQISANLLNDCISLDANLDSDDENSSTRGEITEDPAASQAFQKSEDEIYTKELHTALEEAMAQNLTEREAHILRSRYYDCQSLQAVGNELGVQRETIRQIEHRCIRKLQKLPQLQRWHDDIVSTRAWQGTGFGAWKRSGSVQERTVEYLEERNIEQYIAFLEKAAQLAPEHRATIEKIKAEHYARLEQSGYYNRHPEKQPDIVAIE